MIHMKKRYSVDIESANTTLQNILQECDKEPNSIPFDKLVYSNTLHTAYAKTCRIVSLLLLMFICISPLFFRNPGFSVKNSGFLEKIIVIDHQLYDDRFVLYLSGTNINYNDIYARKNDGTFVFPMSMDEDMGEVVFPFENSSLNIYIPDISGNMLQAVLTTPEETTKQN